VCSSDLLLELAEIRIAAHRWGIRSIHLEDQYAVFVYSSGQLIGQLAGLSGGRLRVVDAQTAYLPLDNGVAQPEAVFREMKSLLQRQ
jgi:transcription-repair coupling factor (superfamily II helicase)